MAHLLLIEDTYAIGNNIVTYLEHDGFSVDRSTDGQEGKDRTLSATYDLIVLDIMLPGLDGVSLLQELRTKKQTPVIMTTAKGQIEDKQQAYDLGADDYLVKPFALEELVMRIRALLKRTEISDIYRLGTLEIDLENKTITDHGVDIHVTMKEFLILAFLLESRGHPVSRSDLLEFVWGGEALYEHDAKLDVYIANLRKKLGKELIETIKGYGYRMLVV